MTGKDFSGPTPEIRAPDRPAMVSAPAEEASPPQEETENQTLKKRKTKKASDDGLVVIGDAFSIVDSDEDGP